MRVIVLRPWAYNRALVVVVVLITNVQSSRRLIFIARRPSGDWKLIGYEDIKEPGEPVGSATRLPCPLSLLMRYDVYKLTRGVICAVASTKKKLFLMKYRLCPSGCRTL